MYMDDQLTQILAKRSIQINPSLSIMQNIANILDEKQNIISNLSEQITKYKCQQMKNEKLVKSLQDKINQLAPNIGNTGSNFMMSSQFKSNFEEFMTSVLPTSLSWAIDKPSLFSKCVEDVFMTKYKHIQKQLDSIIGQVCDNLKISHLKSEKKDLQFKIKLSLLKVLQDYWETILPFKENIKYQYIDLQQKVPKDVLKQMNEGISNEDFIEFQKNLHKLCVYMVLQDKPWEFSGINKGQIIKYSKKEYTCLDGWVKEGEQALLVLSGIVKDGHSHPNLRNYVIPFAQDEYSEDYKALVFRMKEENSVQIEQKPLKSMEDNKNSVMQNTQQINNTLEKEVQIIPLRPILNQDSDFLMKNKSIEIMNNKENYPYAMNKKSKKKDKLKFSMETSLNVLQKSPKNMLRKHDESIKNRKIEIEQVDQRVYLVREESKPKKKSLMMYKNINENNGQLFPLKEKNIEDLPMSKEINQKKKIKANTSRKNSVGKIVNQNHMINHDKENTQSINTSKMKNKDKEKTYKDIIKEKLLDDRMQEKTQHSLNILYPKPRSDREKKKQQNRPLKIQNNANKLREKYIF